MPSRKQGTIRRRSKAGDALTIQVSLGFDPETGKRRFHTETVHGTQEDAQFRIAEIYRDAGRGSPLDISSLTVAEYLEDWLRTHGAVRLRPRTLEGYSDHVRRHIIPRIGHHRLSRLTPRQVRDMEADLLARGRRDGGPLSPRTVLHTHRVLSCALTHAVKSELVPRNVVALVDPPRVSRYEFRSLTFQQAREFIAGLGDPVLRGVVLLAVQTGLRRSEVLALQWRDVDLEKGVLSVRRSLVRLTGGRHSLSEPKSGHGRAVPLVAQSRELLLSMRDGAAGEMDFVFRRGDGTPLRPHTVTQAFRRARTRAGLEGLRLHDLRHTHASLLLQAGTHPKVVSERLGHAKVGITLDTYSHVLPSVQREAAESFGAGWRDAEPYRDEADVYDETHGAAGSCTEDDGASWGENAAQHRPNDVNRMSNLG